MAGKAVAREIRLPWSGIATLTDPEKNIRLGTSYLGQMAEALVAIHGVGVLHRDLKPGNVLFKNDVPKVTDFGLAKVLAPEGDGGSSASGPSMSPPSWRPLRTGNFRPFGGCVRPGP